MFARPDSFNTSTLNVRDLRTGTTPNRRLVTTEMPKVTNSTDESMPIFGSEPYRRMTPAERVRARRPGEYVGVPRAR